MNRSCEPASDSRAIGCWATLGRERGRLGRFQPLSGMIQTGSSLFVIDGQGQVLFYMDTDANQGPASFAFDDWPTTISLGFVPRACWRGGPITWNRIATNLDGLGGEVLSVSALGTDRVGLPSAKTAFGSWISQLPTVGLDLSNRLARGERFPSCCKPMGPFFTSDVDCTRGREPWRRTPSRAWV